MLVLLVVEDRMALRKGTTLDILARDTDMVALSDERAKSKSLRSGEVNVLAFNNRLATVVEDTLQVAVDVKVFRGRANDLTNVGEGLPVDIRLVVWEDLGGKLLGGLEAVPGRGSPLLGRGSVVLGLGETLLQHAPHPLLMLFNILLGKSTFLEQLVNVDVNLRRLRIDALVHQGLGKRGLVSLVVTMLSVADQVNDNIVLELGAPVGSELTDKVDSLNIVGIDVEDGGVNSLGDIRAVSSRASETRVRGEANLVVDNEVNGTTSGESRERVEAKTFVDDTLGGKGSITVKQNTHRGPVCLFVVVVVLNGTGLAQNDGVLSFQVRGVGD